MADISKTLRKLEEEYRRNYIDKPLHERELINQKCFNKYNMGRTALYEYMKASVISGITTISEDVGNNKAKIINQFDNMDTHEFEYKVTQSQNISQDVIRVIIPPSAQSFKYSKSDLDTMYMSYQKLSMHNKNQSDIMSKNIWGYTVREMYNIMTAKFNGDIDYEMSDEDGENDVKLDSYARCDSYSMTKYGCSDEDFGEAEYEEACTYFNNDELYKYQDKLNFEKISECFDNNNYYSTIRKLQLQEGTEDEVLSLGWNPAVPMTMESYRFAQERNRKWFNENKCQIIDLYNNFNYYTENIMITESSSYMRRMYQDLDMYPIYLVLSWTDTPFGKVIRSVKNSQYTHAGLALDSDLKNIYTFKFDIINGKTFNGFESESIDYYYSKTRYSLIDVLVIFVDKTTKEKIEETLDFYADRKNSTKYGFKNIINMLFNKASKSPKENLEMVCSQFVDTVLKMAGINLVDTPSNLVTPKHFEKTESNPKVFKVYDGYVSGYKEKNVENQFKALFDDKLRSDIIIKDAKNVSRPVIEALQELVRPTLAIVERKLPIQVNSSGDLTIREYKSLEREYQEAHKLLTSYTDKNTEGMKHELCRLFYINFVLEDKIKKVKKADDNYKKAVDLRARTLNDFKKYFKVVSAQEPGFDFKKYFDDSEYGSIIIKRSTIKAGGELIKYIAGLKLL